ncbi:MAG: M4 family metallopeptidase [Gammaproteobacteria bacterium]
MCQHPHANDRPHSIFCIIPPHILVEIAKNGSPQQRARALGTLSADSSVRQFRATVAVARAYTPARANAMPGTKPKLQRTIYNAAHDETLPGKVVRTEGSQPSNDPAVDEAYDGLGATFEFFLNELQRNSIDNAGLPLSATVHFGQDYDNAFWNGQQMVFGDGDGSIFNRFTISLDVIGHELTHGVTEFESGLAYSGQSGALNESISDVFGSLIKQYAQKQTADQADWLIGAELLVPGPGRTALRSMKAPGTAYDDAVLGKDPQPAHMKQFVDTVQDNGGVHINSGIPNHAFYLAATALGGYAWEKAGRIWYQTLLDPGLKSNTAFRAFANLTVANADKLFGAASDERRAVQEAWHSVGVL